MHLVLFFTLDVSLQTWAETGLLQREIRLYHELTKRGIRVTFITYGDEADYQYQQQLAPIQIIPYYAFSRKPESRLGKLLHSLLLPWILRKFLWSASLFKTNQMWGGWNGVLAKYLWRRPLLVRCGYEHYFFTIKQGKSKLTQFFIKWISWITYHAADRICVASPADYQWVHQVFKISHQQLRLQMNWVDHELFIPGSAVSYPDHLLFVGRLHPQKNLPALIAAMGNTKYTLDIVGRGSEESALRDLAARHHCSVHFLGTVPHDQLPELINRYPIYILTSHYEGNPKTLLEAMSCGRAVIGTAVPGIQTLIEHRKNGYLCQTDTESIRQAVETVMADGELRELLGKEARNSILKQCTLESYVQKEIALYAELLPAAAQAEPPQPASAV